MSIYMLDLFFLANLLLGSLCITVIMTERDFLYILRRSAGRWRQVAVVVAAEAGALLITTAFVFGGLFARRISTYSELTLPELFFGGAMAAIVYGISRAMLWQQGFRLAIRQG